jgi:FAD/FMN-containing dehydrogenase
MVLGSEGSFGVITQATLKIKPAPEVKQYGEYYYFVELWGHHSGYAQDQACSRGQTVR